MVKVKKPTRITAPVNYEFFVYPIGKLANQNIFALFESFGLMLDDRDVVRLHLAGGSVSTWPIPRLAMFQLQRSKDFVFGEDYRLFRKNLVTGAVTNVPQSYFQTVRTDPLVKAVRRALVAIEKAKARK